VGGGIADKETFQAVVKDEENIMQKGESNFELRLSS
jgi:hypothetical protein